MPAENETLHQALSTAFAAFERGDAATAGRLCHEVLASEPTQPDALLLLGVIAAQDGRLDEAESALRQALAVAPGAAFAHFNLGNVLYEQGRHEEALASYMEAIDSDPSFVAADVQRNVMLTLLGCAREAVEGLDAIVATSPHPEAFYHRGNALRKLGRFDDSVRDYDRALAIDDGLAQAWNNKGNSLRELKRPREALACYDRAIALDPRFAEAHLNRGSALRDLRRLDDAVASYDAALALCPDHVAALTNRCIVLRELNRPAEAAASAERALRVDPQDADAHWNLSLCRLMLGDFERGWPDYEWRWQLDQARPSRRDFPKPLWLGTERIAGKTILLHAEQGLGDTLQFCRFVKSVSERGARVVLEVQPPLVALLSGLDGVAAVVARGEPLPEFDCHCPLMSLPLALGTRLDTLPSAPYIRADAELARTWSGRLGPRAQPRIGLAWSGNAETASVFPRSIALTEFADLLSCPAKFVSLQKDVPESDREQCRGSNVVHFGAGFADTAALIESLDLVVTIDTSIAHLAGAMGKPTWILLPAHADWIWLLDREDTPWYPTARLFRSRDPGTWQPTISRVTSALPAFIASLASVR